MICSWCILIYKKEITWRFVQFTRYRDDITISPLVLLVCMENIFKELFLHTTSRGVPFDCGCKGRHFLQTDQTLQQLFCEIFLTNILRRWFSNKVQKQRKRNFWGKWNKIDKYMLQNIKQKEKIDNPKKFALPIKKITFHIHLILKNIYLRDV